MKKIMLSILLIFIMIFLGCSKESYVFKIYYLDEAFSIVPIITIIDYEEKIKKLDIENNLNEIVQRLDKKFNVFDEDSLISKVNNSSGNSKVVVDDEFMFVLETAINVSKQTELNNKSLYDISIYAIWKEWDFSNNYYQYDNFATIPSDDIIKQKLPLVNYNNIIIDKTSKQVFLKNKGMMIDLGSIVKGYAADMIYSYLKSININNALIDIGGNIITMGKNIGTNKNWKAGILLPYSYDTEIGYIQTNGDKETLVTSGIYERYIVAKNFETNEEVAYHHILNPDTGYPENNELLSVTIITNNSMIADALSTAVFLMGKKDGLNYVNETSNVEAVFITKNNEIILSKNIKNRFVFNDTLINNNYKIII